jgi:YD repeat-containing protein
VLTLTSPDTGATSNTYDNAGNLKTKTDAKGQLTTYSYDALNRLTQAVYTGGQTINYTYDQGVNGLGRLTTITDSTGSTSYAYDNRGRVSSEARTINAITYTTTYAYNTAGQLSGVAYPTGLVLTYSRDSLGRVNQISSTKSNQTQVLASNISYQPFGGVKSFTYGNGSTYNRSFDTDNRLASYTLGTKTINLDYDLASRIIAATNAANSTDSKTYAYDNLDRLTSFIAPTTNQGYGYDLTGNRTSLTIGANNYSNTIAASSNRLTAMTGPTLKTNTFDNNGSITNDTVNQFVYDTRGRLIQSVGALGTTNYGINALGQRVIKSRTGTNATNVVYHYDLNGQQIAETDSTGVIKQETIYLGNMPLAVMQ